MARSKNKLSSTGQSQLVAALKNRFEKNMNRHKGIRWDDVETKLKASSDKLWSLAQMEKTGGEPDVVSLDRKAGTWVFVDCAAESPAGRRSLCYDHEALEKRKENKPQNSAIQLAADMGVELLTETEYRQLQTVGKFDSKTSSWVKTPADIRKAGGAIFCDWRYGHVFTYHNGAESYYAARGFRALLHL